MEREGKLQNIPRNWGVSFFSPYFRPVHHWWNKCWIIDNIFLSYNLVEHYVSPFLENKKIKVLVKCLIILLEVQGLENLPKKGLGSLYLLSKFHKLFFYCWSEFLKIKWLFGTLLPNLKRYYGINFPRMSHINHVMTYRLCHLQLFFWPHSLLFSDSTKFNIFSWLISPSLVNLSKILLSWHLIQLGSDMYHEKTLDIRRET
jgi:hypothetical protein